MNKYCLCYNY